MPSASPTRAAPAVSVSGCARRCSRIKLSCCTPAGEPGAKSQLWRVPADRLKSGAIIGGVETIAGGELPPRAERLVVQPAEKRAIVVIDGDTGKQDARWKVSAREMTVALP